MSKNRFFKRIVWLLAAVMVLSLLPVFASAGINPNASGIYTKKDIEVTYKDLSSESAELITTVKTVEEKVKNLSAESDPNLSYYLILSYDADSPERMGAEEKFTILSEESAPGSGCCIQNEIRDFLDFQF